MKRTVLTFGLIAGAVLSAMMVITLPFIEKIGFDKGMVIGYTTMVLAFLLVFFGIRSYRDTVGGGQISFAKGLGVGLLIMLIASVCYVITWEIVSHTFLPDFAEKCVAYELQNIRASGKPAAEMEREIEQMRSMMDLYMNNIFFNIAFTFLEPLPVGLVMTLISALILRKRPREEQQLAPGLPDLQN